MSRYVQLRAPSVQNLDELRAALTTMALPIEHKRGRTMLEGSIECAGEPVDVRLPAGTLDAVEDFGFALENGELDLVCGEFDRELLEQALLAPLRQTLAERRIRAAAADAGLIVEQSEQSEDRRRLVLRRRD